MLTGAFAISAGKSGRRWKLTEAEAIRAIERGTTSFYVRKGNDRVEVIVAKRNERKYLKTVADGVRPNNLLALPECP